MLEYCNMHTHPAYLNGVCMCTIASIYHVGVLRLLMAVYCHLQASGPNINQYLVQLLPMPCSSNVELPNCTIHTGVFALSLHSLKVLGKTSGPSPSETTSSPPTLTLHGETLRGVMCHL